MPSAFRISLAGFAACLWMTAAALASPADEAFAALGADYLDRFPALSPVAATRLGDHRFDGELNDVSDAARARALAFNEEMLARLQAIDVAALSTRNQVDAELLRNALEYSIWSQQELQEWAWNPLRYTQLTGGSIYSLMARDFAPLEERLASVASRLEAMPRLLAQVRETLQPDRVPPIHAETAARQNRGVIAILDNMVKPELDNVGPALKGRLERAMETATAAVETHQAWLETELIPAAKGEFRIGEALFDRKLAFTLHTPLSRQEIRQRAEAEFEAIRAEMFDLARIVYRERYPLTTFPDDPGPDFRQAIIRAALEVAYEEIPARDGIVDTAREYLDQATAFVREKDLVTVPDDPVEIIVMPEFQRGVSVAYCDPPGPLDEGQKTFYAVAPLPEDWSDAQVKSFLREYNLLSIQDLTIHEAMPGHFLQIAHSNRYPSTLRAVLWSGPFVEGWAVYAQEMMIEAGYGEQNPLAKLINRKWYLRAIANAIIDQAIHVDGMERDEAMRLMVEGAFQEESEAAGKWVRAQLSSAQLSTYFVGFQEHADLRREVETAWGEEFALKRYHDEVLSFGSPPVQFVRALMLDEPVPRGAAP